jgi:hypothetical protein
MRREEFIKRLGLGFLAIPLFGKVKPEEQRTVIYSGYLAGISYYELKNVYHFLSEGQRLTLRREPSNSYDQNAISIWFHEHKLGFIPKKDNMVIANLMDGYFELTASISKIKKEKFLPPSGIKIEIKRKGVAE